MRPLFDSLCSSPSGSAPTSSLPIASPWTVSSASSPFTSSPFSDPTTCPQTPIDVDHCPPSPLPSFPLFPSASPSLTNEEPCPDPESTDLHQNAPEPSPQTPFHPAEPKEKIATVATTTTTTRLNKSHVAELLAMWSANPTMPTYQARAAWAAEHGLKIAQVYQWFKSHEKRTPAARLAFAESVLSKQTKQAGQ